MHDLLPNVITLLAALIGSGTILAIRDRRRAAREQAEARRVGQPAIDMTAITGAAATLVQELQEELTHARQAVAASATVTARMSGLEASVTALEGRVSTLLGWIHEPAMTLDLLRRLAPLPPGGVNGR